jgi:hypothetical protein
MDRRDFISRVLRNLILTGLLFISGFLLFRKESRESCDFDFVCKNCKKMPSCSLPEAKQAKSKN